MLELLFSDSACGAMKQIKGKKDYIGGAGAQFTMDEDGNYSSEPFTPEPYTGPTLEGSSNDVLGFWMAASMGDISDPNDWLSRLQWLDHHLLAYEDEYFEDDWAVKETKHAKEEVTRLLDAANSGEPIRIWWSDDPDETCGFYWALWLLQDTDATITAVKLARPWVGQKETTEFRSYGEVPPELFSELLSLEREISSEERRFYAERWSELMAENAPLRAVINGTVLSVPEDFYDFALLKALSAEPCRVAMTIGTALIHGPSGVSDWWYLNRLKQWIDQGEILLLEHKKPFYGSLIQKRVYK